jgi:hypothetical protein
MKEITVKPQKHLIIIQLPHDLSTDVMEKLKRNIHDSIPGLNFLLCQPETELTVLKLED